MVEFAWSSLHGCVPSDQSVHADIYLDSDCFNFVLAETKI